MFFFLFSSAFSLNSASAKNFNSKLKESPITVVFFNMNSKLKETKNISTVLDKLSDKYEPNVRFLRTDAIKIAQQYGVSFAQQIGIFRGLDFSGFYNGPWTFESMDKLCDDILNSDFQYINNYFEFYRFQSGPKPNIIITDSSKTAKAVNILSNFGGLLNVGILNNSKIAAENKLSLAQLCHPMADICYNLTTLDVKEIAKHMTTSIKHIANEHIIGQQPMKEGYILLALLDESDPKHVHDVAENFHFVEEFFLKNISYQEIDFFNAKNLVSELSIISFTQPIYIYIELNNRGNKVNVYQRLLPTGEELLQWLKMLILNIKPERNDEIEIPVLHAKEFIDKALNPKKDVILLVAQKRMKRYNEARENFQIIAKIFQDYSDRIELYEFDNVAEKVDGLSLPSSKDPQISVWSASEEPDGSTFTALASVAVLLDNIIQLIKAEFNQEEFEKMADTLQQIMGTS